MSFFNRSLVVRQQRRLATRSKIHRMSSLVSTSDWIYGALYDPNHGYFSKVDVIASPPQGSIKFGDLMGKTEYREAVANVYAQSEEGWSTPAELFAPVYSQGLARYLLRWLTRQRSIGSPKQTLRVYELGGGMGNNARHICDYIRAVQPTVYKRMSYTIVEISPRLSQHQNAALKDHSGVARSMVMDAMELGSSCAANGSPLCSDPCMVIALEVLDNLPHDKLVCLGGQLHESWVRRVDKEDVDPRVAADAGCRPVFEEVYLPVHSTAARSPSLAAAVAQLMGIDSGTGQTDHEKSTGSNPAEYKRGLLSSLASILPGSGRWPGSLLPPAPTGLQWARYIPTGAYRLLVSLRKALPRHDLLLADFTELPPPSVQQQTVHGDSAVLQYAPGAGAPLTASKDTSTRKTRDHATYLSAKAGTADIFFPTDFRSLAKIVEATAAEARAARTGQAGSGKLQVKLQSQAAFLKSYAEVERTRTILGYNPLLEDYPNTAVLTTGLQ